MKQLMTAYDMVLCYSGELVTDAKDTKRLEGLVEEKKGMWYSDVLETSALAVRDGSTVEQHLEKLGFLGLNSEIVGGIEIFCEHYGEYVIGEDE